MRHTNDLELIPVGVLLDQGQAHRSRAERDEELDRYYGALPGCYEYIEGAWHEATFSLTSLYHHIMHEAYRTGAFEEES